MTNNNPSTFRPTLASRCAVAIASAFATLAVVSPAYAASPADNDDLRAALIAQVALHDVSVIGGIAAIGWTGTPFEIAAISSDFSLKFTPPEFELSRMGPNSTAPLLQRVPNAPLPDGLVGANCTYRFDSNQLPEIDDNNTRGISSGYSSIFGINFDPVDDVYSELGTPRVFHPHADVNVSVDNPFLGVPAYPGLSSNQVRDLQQYPRFPEGRHTLSWRAEAGYHPVLDGVLPVTLMAVSGASKNYLTKKLAARGATKEAAERIAKNTFRLVNLAVELELTAVDVSSVGQATEWYRDTLIAGGRNSINQQLLVWDINQPFFLDSADLPIGVFSRNEAIEEQAIEIEATDFGGVRFRRVKEELQNYFAAADLCGKSMRVAPSVTDAELLEIGPEPNIVEWAATEVDGGPYRSDVPLAGNQQLVGEDIVTTLTQRITVVDTQAPILVPPPGFARYDEDGIDLVAEEFPLGRPRVVDLADPSPTVEYTIEADDPSFDQTFLPGPPEGADGVRYRVTWDAVDDSLNSALANSNTPGEFVQTITLKRPGTNTAPTADGPIAVNAVTAESVDILLTGIDTDMIDGSVDPLSFEIDQLPGNGQFEAPLYPYFIEDFRLTPVGEREEGDNTTRTSPLGFLAEGFANTLPENHGTYLVNEICNASPGSPSFTEFGGVIPIDMVYEPTFVHVDDDGFYYFRDKYYVCGETIKQNQDQRADLSPIPRLSRWSPDGELVSWAPLYETDDPADLETPDAGFIWPLPGIEIDNGGRLWVPFRAILTNPGTVSITWYSYDPELTGFRFHNIRSFPFSPVPTGNGQYAVTTDAVTDLMFEVTRDQMLVWDQTGVLDWTDAAAQVGELDVSGIAFDAEPVGQLGNDMAIDSEGNVYILDTRKNRLHKWLPTRADGEGGWTFGDYVGWLGSCTANNLIPGTTTPYNACDVDTGTSRGFACTDQKCARAATPAETAGAATGQFDAPEAIEIDPNDVVYVADTANSRIQRFGSDGTFAGQAVSTGSGINLGDEPGFILGNIGQPKQLSVNSTAFFVMEPDPQNGDNFVNVFKTSPLREVTDSSAVVRYVSDFNFQGGDSFTYRVDDGIDESAPASVSVTVTRAFRPPEQLRAECFLPGDLGNEVPCVVPEDGALDVRLSSQDPDGFLADAPNGLDTHTFNIVEETILGSLTIEDPSLQQDNSIVYRYTPDPNVHGMDEFSFDVFDGVVSSEDVLSVEIEIQPVPDMATIDLDPTMTAARGFRRGISAEYDDVDRDPDYEPELVQINWGDGTRSLGASWENSGNYDANGREINPQIEFTVNEGAILGSHQFDTLGDFTLRMEVFNPSDSAELPSTVATSTVSVIDATVLGSELLSPTDAVNPDTPFPLDIEITNYLPDSWAGLTAGNVRVTIELPDGIDIVSLDGRCTQNEDIECLLGDLLPDASTTIGLTANVSLETARETPDFVFTLEIFDDGPKADARTFTVESLSIADRDGDGVIDVDDAFADDADYSVDTDGDGIPDGWELAYGFDPTVADDAASDIDGDGFTLLEEYRNRSFPNLAEIERAAVGETVAPANSGDNRFGWSVAGGDINQDGFADVLIGAPGDSATGNAYILFGGDAGDVGGMQRIAPRGNITGYGRSVAVGDWDDNGYPDVAVGHDNGFYVHYNNGSILDWQDLSFGGVQPTSNFGQALLNADLDSDGLDDLIVTASSSANGGLVYLYLSSRGGTDGTPLIIIEPATVMGDSVAVGDIDNDTRADLLVGSPGGTASDVFVYLGRDNDWSTIPANPVRSFTLLTPGVATQFGYRVVSGADVGGDGVDDVVVAAYGGAGAIHLYDSADNWVPAFGASVAVPPSQTLLGLDDGSSAGDGFGDQMGVGLALGHLDTDPFADLVVGGNRAGVDDQGQARLFRGSANGFQVPDERVNGSTDFDMLGYSVAIVGDIDNNGYDDVAVGAPDIVANGRPAPDGGYVQLLYHEFAAANPADDPDLDGVADTFDNCPADANTNQADQDGDGTGDACDPDVDGDGFDNELDNCPTVASANQDDFDGDGLGDVCDDDDDNDGTVDSEDAFPRDPNYTTDSDADGMPDAFETANGLDPQNAADASEDLDGDGRSNLEEFLQGGDVAADDVAPVLTVPANLIVDATGYRTPVDIGNASATDALDGVLSAMVDNPGPYRPGRHQLTWSVADAAGNTATGAQVVDVNPLVNFSRASADVTEGSVLGVYLELNGPAPAYPVRIDLATSGSATAGADYGISNSTVVINAGVLGSTVVDIVDDGVADDIEEIVLSIAAAQGAAAGGTVEQRLRILEGNVLPTVDIDVTQNGALRTDAIPTEGPVRLDAAVVDPNAADTHVFDWTGTDNALVPAEGFTASSFTFDVSGLAAGVYRAQVRVIDSGDPAQPQTASRWIRVLSAAPVLDAAADTDGDGIDDQTEGYGDADLDGTPDWQDATGEAHLLTARAGEADYLQTDPGLVLSLGSTAMASGPDAAITLNDVQLYGSNGGQALAAEDPEFDYLTGVVDFSVRGLARAGDSARIVIPLGGTIPANAIYRKYFANIGWQSFVEDANNRVESAPGTAASCPAPGSSLYRPGLTEGDRCVQLTINDGGPNDADGTADRVIRDPGGVAMRSVVVVLALEALSLPDVNVAAGQTNVPMLRFRLNSNSGSTRLDAITLAASGSGNDAGDVSAVKLWADLDADGAVSAGDLELGTGQYAADNGTLTLNATTDFDIPSGNSDYLVTYDY